MIPNARLYFLLAGAVILGVSIWMVQLFLPQTVESPQIAGIYFSQPLEVVDFSLLQQNGRPFTREDLKGKWSFLYFGYTYCPDVCPMTLAQLNLVDQRLVQQGLDKDVAYVMISVDPRRDTPERLAQYAAYFNKKFQGVTGAPAELDKLARQFGIYYKLNDQNDPKNYSVDHSNVVMLIDPAARLRAVFTAPDQADRLFADFIKIRALPG